MAFDGVAEALSVRGFAVIEDFLSASETRRLAAAARDTKAEFSPAHVGRGPTRALHPEIRSDLIRWTEPDGELKEKLDTLKTAINRSLFLGLKDFEGHLAVYPAGACYQKHFDNFRDSSPRAVSCVIYLNDDWREGDAGELRIFAKDDHDLAVLDVQPRGGTLALFLSREIPHEVLAPKRERVSFTGWFRDR